MTSNESKEEMAKTWAYRDGHLAINAGGRSITPEEAANVIKQAAIENDTHSLLVYNCVEYEEPYYWTVAPWVSGLAKVSKFGLKKLVIDTPFQVMNRQFGIYVGDITPVLVEHANIQDLFVSGSFDLTSCSLPELQTAHFAKANFGIEDVRTIANIDAPNLSRLAINAGEDGPSEEFTHCLIDSLSTNQNISLKELYLDNWVAGDQAIKQLCESEVVSRMDLVHVSSFELGYDPEETLEMLVINADKLNKLRTLRIPFNGFMDDEREKLIQAIPRIENTHPEENANHKKDWIGPFSPSIYGSDSFPKK